VGKEERKEGGRKESVRREGQRRRGKVDVLQEMRGIGQGKGAEDS
jgi:hypothetical protein